MAKFIVNFMVSVPVECEVSPETQDELNNVYYYEDVKKLLEKEERKEIIAAALKKASVHKRDVDSIEYFAEETD